jgi:hypothetical protein
MTLSKLTFTTLALATLVACGGGGSATSVAEAAPPVAASNVENSASIDFGSIHIPSETGYNGTRSIGIRVLANGDINGDGHGDIVIGLAQFPDSTGNIGEIKPIVLFYDPATKKFKVDSQLQSILPTNQFPRQAAILDINGDGRMDLFIGDHGYDEAPYGAQNKLILNTATGYVNRTDLLPQVWDYSHGLIVGDFDRNGTNDLFVLNNITVPQLRCANYPAFTDCPAIAPVKESNSYIVYGTSFTKSMINMDNPADILTPAGQSNRISVGGTSDFNKDGVPDIVVTRGQEITIMESKAVGSYKIGQRVSPPTSLRQTCAGNIAYSFVSMHDIDNDGTDEIFASYACGEGSWTDQRFQVVKRIGNVWTDVTSQVIPNQTGYAGRKGHWCWKIVFEDINNDGKKDIICNSLAGFNSSTNNVFWMQQANGTFEFKDLQLKNKAGTGMHIVVTLGGERYLLGVGADYSYRPPTMNDYVKITGWKLK